MGSLSSWEVRLAYSFRRSRCWRGGRVFRGTIGDEPCLRETGNLDRADDAGDGETRDIYFDIA